MKQQTKPTTYKPAVKVPAGLPVYAPKIPAKGVRKLGK